MLILTFGFFQMIITWFIFLLSNVGVFAQSVVEGKTVKTTFHCFVGYQHFGVKTEVFRVSLLLISCLFLFVVIRIF